MHVNEICMGGGTGVSPGGDRKGVTCEKIRDAQRHQYPLASRRVEGEAGVPDIYFLFLIIYN